MKNQQEFKEIINDGYNFEGESLYIGNAMLDGRVVDGAVINLPLKTMNRHGLIAGATGTGKTKTLQMISEGLSNASVPVLLLDIKGDLSGIAMPGSASPKLEERCALLGLPCKFNQFPVELLTLSGDKGVRLKATVSEFGPVLLSKILGLNDTQGGVLSMIFEYCDDKKLPILDLKDFKKVLQYASEEGKSEFEDSYGKISTTTTGTILRKVVELQQQGGDLFFGEKSFEVEDLMRIDDQGRGMINILRVADLADRPKLFSTFMLQLLAELYSISPEEGDLEKPKLVMFIDEAHLIFQEASNALLQQIETVVKLIRSKGIGIFFVTQNPMDVPAGVLGQLGLKVQHALRAFTAADRKVIKQTAENYPDTDFYETDELITELGIGEALVTMLNEKGIPTPLAHVMLAPPSSRMDVLTDVEIESLVGNSKLALKYNREVDSESAYEMLNSKLEEASEVSGELPSNGSKTENKEESFFDHPIVRSVGRTAATMITRSLLGALGLGGRSRKKSIW